MKLSIEIRNNKVGNHEVSSKSMILFDVKGRSNRNLNYCTVLLASESGLAKSEMAIMIRVNFIKDFFSLIINFVLILP